MGTLNNLNLGISVTATIIALSALEQIFLSKCKLILDDKGATKNHILLTFCCFLLTSLWAQLAVIEHSHFQYELGKKNRYTFFDEIDNYIFITLLDWGSTLVRISFLSHNFQDFNNLKSKYAFLMSSTFNLRFKWDSKMKRTKNTYCVDWLLLTKAAQGHN